MGCAPVTVSPRLQNLVSWDSDWAGLRVVVTGIGVSGFAAADTLIELGARVVVVDAATTETAKAQADTLKIVGAVDVLLGDEAVTRIPKVDGSFPDLIVTSPGWRPDQALLAAAARAHIPVWGDVELAWRLRVREGHKTADWLTITGTNGKTTTVGLTASMLQAAGLKAIAVGNVGTPILDALRDPVEYDVFAVELSSFQLHWAESLSPVASVCLNVAEDHVDWHGSYNSYLADKAKVYARTQKACIFNAEQIETERMVEDADVVEGCRAVGFTTVTPAISMLGVVEGLLVDRAFIEQRKDSAAELASMADLGAVCSPSHGGQRPCRGRHWSAPMAWTRRLCEGASRTTCRATTASRQSPARTVCCGSTIPRPPTRTPQRRRWRPLRTSSGSPVGSPRGSATTTWSGISRPG